MSLWDVLNSDMLPFLHASISTLIFCQSPVLHLLANTRLLLSSCQSPWAPHSLPSTAEIHISPFYEASVQFRVSNKPFSSFNTSLTPCKILPKHTTGFQRTYKGLLETTGVRHSLWLHFSANVVRNCCRKAKHHFYTYCPQKAVWKTNQKMHRNGRKNSKEDIF